VSSGPEVATEINCIRAYYGNGYVKLWEYSLEDGTLLLERVTPGTQMWATTDYKEQARLMAQVIKNLHFIQCEQGEYPSYFDERSLMRCEKDSGNGVHYGPGYWDSGSRHTQKHVYRRGTGDMLDI